MMLKRTQRIARIPVVYPPCVVRPDCTIVDMFRTIVRIARIEMVLGGVVRQSFTRFQERLSVKVFRIGNRVLEEF